MGKNVMLKITLTAAKQTNHTRRKGRLHSKQHLKTPLAYLITAQYGTAIKCMTTQIVI